MADFANVHILGRLTKDPDVRFGASGTAVVNISVAVERITKGKGGAEDKKEVSFFDAVVFGKHGEHVAERLRKGSTVAIMGQLRQRSWEKDGKKHYKVEVVADRVFGDGNGAPAEAEGGAKPKANPPAEQDIEF